MDSRARVRAANFAVLLQRLRSGQIPGGIARLVALKGRPLGCSWLARQLEVSAALIHRYEHGHIDPLEVKVAILQRLAHLLGRSMEETLDFCETGVWSRPTAATPDLSEPLQRLREAMADLERLATPLSPVRSFSDQVRDWFSDLCGERADQPEDTLIAVLAAYPGLGEDRHQRLRQVLAGQRDYSVAEALDECVALAIAFDACSRWTYRPEQFHRLLQHQPLQPV
jgi:transcriptional regulator with XRE-family HTH domain